MDKHTYIGMMNRQKNIQQENKSYYYCASEYKNDIG